jgi:hypothetical protein
MQGAWYPLMQPTMVQSKAFNIITRQSTPTPHQEGTPYLTHGMWWLILWFWALGTFTSTQSSLVENICMTTSYHWFGSINHVLIEVSVPSQEGEQSYTMYSMCVWEVSFNLSLICPFYWNFSDGGIFLLSYYIYFLWKKHSTIMLEPKQFINHHIFCFFLQNGRGNNIQTWIKLHKDSYGSVTSFTTCCTSTVWQRISSRSFAEHIE